MEAWATAAGVNLTRDPPVRASGPVDCEPWCSPGDGHPDATYREDQCCWSEEELVELSLQPAHPGRDLRLPRRGRGPPAGANLEAYAMRRPDEPVHVRVSHDGGPEISLTPVEAGQLVAALQRLLSQVGAA